MVSHRKADEHVHSHQQQHQANGDNDGDVSDDVGGDDAAAVATVAVVVALAVVLEVVLVGWWWWWWYSLFVHLVILVHVDRDGTAYGSTEAENCDGGITAAASAVVMTMVNMLVGTPREIFEMTFVVAPVVP